MTCISALRRLMDGYPVGAAFEVFQEMYAEQSTEVSAFLEDLNYATPADLAKNAGQIAAYANARGMAIFGDPAVRLLRRP